MILVTGATGILGRVIVLELLKKGKKVRATKRKSSNLKDVSDSYKFYTDQPDFYFNQVEWIDADFNNMESLKNALQNVEEVYHCAAKVGFNPKYEKELYKTNVDGTKNLLYAIEQSSVKKFLFVSSIAVLDGYNEDGLTDEDSDFNPKVDHSAYAISKHLAEMEVWRALAEGLSTVIINPGMIIGSGNWGHSSGKLFQEMSNGFTFPGSTALVDVRDVSNIALELMEKSVFGERFIITSENVKFKHIADKVRKYFGKKPAVIISNSILNLLPFFSVMLGWLIPFLQLGNRTNVETIKADSKITNKKIRETLNYEFIQIDESIDFHLKNYAESIQKSN